MSDLIERSKVIDAIMAEDCLGYVECQTEWLTDRINAIPKSETGAMKLFNWICSHPLVRVSMWESDYMLYRCLRLELRLSSGEYIVNIIHLFDFDKLVNKEEVLIDKLNLMYNDLVRKAETAERSE